MKPEQGELFVANEEAIEFKILWREVAGFIFPRLLLLAPFHQATGIGGDWSG